MMAKETALVGESCGPELVFLPPGARTMPVLTVGGASDIGISTQASAHEAGDLFVDTDSGITSIWSGTTWDDIGALATMPITEFEGRGAARCPCLYCGTLNLPDAVECGADRWVGCGAPLRNDNDHQANLD